MLIVLCIFFKYFFFNLIVDVFLQCIVIALISVVQVKSKVYVVPHVVVLLDMVSEASMLKIQ